MTSQVLTPIVARCNCGQFSIELEGEPKFVNACACRNCQRQGSGPLGVGVFFPKQALKSQTGTSKAYSRSTDKGHQATQHFCPECGSEIYWTTGAVPDCVGVSWGAMEDPKQFKPNWVVWARSLPDWLEIKNIKHFDTQPEN